MAPEADAVANGSASQLIPPALAVGDALSKQFKRFANTVVEKGDMSDTAAFKQLIEGFKVVSEPAGPRLLAHLLHWRVSSLSEAGRERNDQKMLRRRLWTEAMFLEATLQLVSAFPAVLTSQQAREMEHLAFDWILNADKYVAVTQGDLGTIKERVILDAARLLGALSPQKLSTIKERFLRELALRLRSDANSTSRIELYNLCHGMRFVTLCANTSAQFEASISFLESTHPLKHVAPDKKSRVQQSMCDMLSSILQPLVDQADPGEFGAGCSGELRTRWFNTVKVVRSDLLRWALKQSKQVTAAYPLLVALSCTKSDGHFVSAVDGFIDHLHKQLREKKNASMAVMCIARCVHCYARRARPRTKEGQASLAKWLSRVATPVVQLMVRGGLLLPEQQELVRQLVFVVAQHHPEYAVTLLLELLQADGVSWEAPLTGVSALLSVLTEAPRRLLGIAPQLELEATAQGLERLRPWQPAADDVAQLELLARRGVNPFEAYGVGGAMRRISAALSKLVVQCHTVYGLSRLGSGTRPYTEGPARERVGPLPVFVTCLQCVPFVLPDHWVGPRLFDDLSGYSIHPETSMRSASIQALRRSLRTLPPRRDELVGAFALFCVRLPDDSAEVAHDSVTLLLALLREWTEAAREEAPVDGASSQALQSLPNLEGCALGLLCASSVKTRRLALTLARQARTLHGALRHQRDVSVWRSDGSATSWAGGFAPAVDARRGAASALFVADVLEAHGSAIVSRAYWDFGKWSDLWRRWRPVPQRASFEDCLGSVRQATDHIRWSRVLCELMKEAWKRCPGSSRIANLEVYAKLLALVQLDSAGRQTISEARLDTARAYCMVVTAAPYTEGDRAPEGDFSTREFVRLLLAAARAGPEPQQRIAVLALGNVSQSCHRFVVQECSQLGEDYLPDRHAMPRSLSVPVPGMGRTHKPRREDVRLAHANILRLVAENLQADALAEYSALREKMVHFLSETARHIGSIGELSPELVQLRYCLCVVARRCSGQLADALPKAFGADTRRTFFDMMSMFCEEGAPGHYKIELRRGVLLARSRIKDPEQARALESDITDASDVLEHAAYLGMAAVLKGTMFNRDVRDPKGRVFSWIDRMLSSKQLPQSTPGCWGPPKAHVAAAALRNLLTSNVVLAQVFVDRCYSNDPRISSGYFKVLSEVFSNVGATIPLDAHILLSLIMHKIADDREDIRLAAQAMLNVLLKKQGRFDLDATERLLDIQNPENLVIGGLSDSYRGFRVQLAEALSIAFPAVAEPLSLEVLKRTREQMDSPGADVAAIACLCPWLRKITISPQWRGRWADRFLSLLYEVTAHRLPHQFSPVEQLWATLAQDRRNVVPVLDFLLVRCLEEDRAAEGANEGSLSPFVSAKQATLYISRVAPRQTIEHLVYEIQQQLTVGEEGEPRVQASDSGQILEYQHARGSRPYQRLEVATGRGDGAPSRETSRLSVAASPTPSESSAGVGTSVDHARPPGSDSGRGAERHGFSKSEIALVLLADVACEQDEEFRPHLHILLHVITISADSSNPDVRRECWQLLTFLLYTLSLKHIDSREAQGEYHQRVSAMIARLQGLGNRPMWPRERPTLSRPFIPSAAAVAGFVKEVVDCFFLNADLREKWWGEALKWACTAHSRQLASRSHQVFCALRPTLSSLSCSAMMAALQKCMNNANIQKLDTAVEVLGTLRELLSNVEPSKFLLYPQVILAAISLLNSSVVRIGELAMVILLQALSNVDLGDAIVRNILVAMISAPPATDDEGDPPSQYDWEIGRELFREGVGDTASGQPWIAVQQLVIKGLFQEETEGLALKVLTALNLQLCKGFPEVSTSQDGEAGYMSSDSLAYDLFKSPNGPEPTALESVLGHARAGLAIGLAASLPYLCVHLRDPSKTDVLGPYIRATADASATVGWDGLKEGLLALQSLVGVDLAYEAWARPFCEILGNDLFPEFLRLVIQRMLEVVQHGSASYQRAAVGVVKSIFETADSASRAAFKVDANWRVSTALAPYIGTSIGERVLDVYEAMVQTSDDETQPDPEDSPLDWPQSIDPLGDCNKICSESLQRIVTAGASAEGGSQLDVLPFIK